MFRGEGVPLAAPSVPDRRRSDPNNEAQYRSAVERDLERLSRKITSFHDLLRKDEVYNVKAYGAVGDGTTDDTEAIQAALDDMPSVSDVGAGDHVGTLFFPVGDYLISSPLLFESGHRIVGASKAGSRILVDGSISAFTGRDAGSSPIYHVVFRDLTINQKATRPAGSVGLDLEGVSFYTVERVRLRKHETGVLCFNTGETLGAGFYNRIVDIEAASNTIGIHLHTEANSHKIIGGRINGNTTGLKLEQVNDVYVSTSLESNNRAIYVLDGSRENSIIQSRFEGNTEGVVCDSGTFNNFALFCHWSNTSDDFTDLDGRNHRIGDHGAMGPGFGYPAYNLIPNGEILRDSDGDGLADGLNISLGATPPGHTASLDSSKKVSGSFSQKYHIDGGTTSTRSLWWTASLTPGIEHSIVFRFSTDYDENPFEVRGGTSAGTGAGSADYFGGFNLPSWGSDFYEVAYTFTPTQEEAFFTIVIDSDLAEAADPANIWIDSVRCSEGAFPGKPGARQRVLIPVGKTTDRPSTPENGDQYYDTDLDLHLTYDGSAWVNSFGASPLARQSYSPSNVTTDRAYDADSTTVSELADVLGTLISDLQDQGVIS